MSPQHYSSNLTPYWYSPVCLSAWSPLWQALQSPVHEWRWRQEDKSLCLRGQRDKPWEARRTLVRVQSSRWVRGLGLVKEPQPARPRGRKEAIKRPTSCLSTGNQLTLSCHGITKRRDIGEERGGTSKGERERDRQSNGKRWVV